MKLSSVIVTVLLLASGVASLDITQTTTLAQNIAPNDVLTVEGGSAVTINEQTQLVLSSLSVDQGGQLFYITTDESATIQIGTIVNNGFISFDASGTEDTYFQIGTTSVQNDGEMVINMNNAGLDMSLQSNTGQLTFWGIQNTVGISGGTNTGNICYYQTSVFHKSASGVGCMALYDSSAYITSAQSDFNPTIVFEGDSSRFILEDGSGGTQYTLIQFGGAHFVYLADEGFSGSNYDVSDGILSVQQNGYQVTFNVGLGYDPGLFEVQADAAGIGVTISYNDAPPPGANTGGCTCVLDTDLPPPQTTSSTRPNGNNNGKGNNNHNNGYGQGDPNDHGKGNNNNNGGYGQGGNNNGNGKGNDNNNKGNPGNGKGNSSGNSPGNNQGKNQGNGKGNGGNGHKRNVDY
ncbi:hypothetical protein JA1_001436 [Spathaspora sp. JA1]|nr:hypothetical protein JA1_001436 [Spathaspora sp. JA1]